ncbi:hypothetical protein [uncultured Haemophilus sp.]|uniref:hypothetical protein n=1 Tax=uncultured Haemophilus sp. TaxID=237779 RepID=UPI0025FE37A0|nr:hypothetical protein [uncultured Haemophilus sp.]
MNDFDIISKELVFTDDEEQKFNQIMPEIDHLLRYSRIGEHILPDNVISPDAFRRRTLKSGQIEDTISLFQMLDEFESPEDESQAFLDFLYSKRAATFVFDDETRTISLLKDKLKEACLRDKQIIHMININKTNCRANQSSKAIAHHWDVTSNDFDAIYAILAKCSEVINCIYKKTLHLNS